MTTTNRNQSLQRNDGGDARDLAALLKSKTAAMEKLAGVMLSSDRLVSLALLATQKTPALLKCSQQSILQSVMDAARLGLEPDGRQAAIIPFKGNAQLVPMVGGLIALAYREPSLETIEAVTVYDCDSFKFKLGTGAFIDHTPALDRPEGAKAIAWYCVTTIRGRHAFDIMGPTEIEAIRKRSPAVRLGFSSPWDTDYDQMALKTVIKRRLKRVPSSPIMREALNHEDEIDSVAVEVTAKTSAKAAAKVAGALQGKPEASDPPPDTCEECGGPDGNHSPTCSFGSDDPPPDNMALTLARALPKDPKKAPGALAAAKQALGEASADYAAVRAVGLHRLGSPMTDEEKAAAAPLLREIEAAGGFVDA